MLSVDDVASDMQYDTWYFFENEYIYCKEYSAIYESILEVQTPQPRGKNSLIDCFSRIRTFFYWYKNNKRTTNTPFDDFFLEECTYGNHTLLHYDR
ncbi:MAG: hypothetical protein IJ338_08170 [Bacteroidaceae bacterium]|nr:hypothetical protein [Bacteroidaceae bacterium]